MLLKGGNSHSFAYLRFCAFALVSLCLLVLLMLLVLLVFFVLFVRAKSLRKRNKKFKTPLITSFMLLLLSFAYPPQLPIWGLMTTPVGFLRVPPLKSVEQIVWFFSLLISLLFRPFFSVYICVRCYLLCVFFSHDHCKFFKGKYILILSYLFRASYWFLLERNVVH